MLFLVEHLMERLMGEWDSLSNEGVGAVGP